LRGLYHALRLDVVGTPLRERWVNASYDNLFRFGARPVTNNIALITIDDHACDFLHQTRTNWDRGLHTELLEKLTQAGCPLVVFDIHFRNKRETGTDQALAEAMRRNGRVVLMARVMDPIAPVAEAARVVLPDELFMNAATNVGVGQAEIGTARRHWPFPASEERDFQSLPWVAARRAGWRPNEKPAEQWLRYYGESGAWQTSSYDLALSNAPGNFRNTIVFIGSTPEQKDPSVAEDDKFRTPYTRWNGKAVGGVEIMATTFLNLMNGDWLRRPPAWVEALVLIVAGLALGAGLYQVRPLVACGLGLATGLAVTFGAVWLSYFTNYWFPWLVIVGGQIPCAFVYSVTASVLSRRTRTQDTITDYELIDPPFGQGAYGKVWLARNAIGQWQALKVIYLAKFGSDPVPYEREFNGIKRYKPISDKHPGLLRVDFVSTRKQSGYFYYVMELGDALEPGWEQMPTTYKPRDLASVLSRAPAHRLPVLECVEIGLGLAEALDFLHRQELTHRDIKPQNIIFVNGRPKLADVGLTAVLMLPDQVKTWVGTPVTCLHRRSPRARNRLTFMGWEWYSMSATRATNRIYFRRFLQHC
jgi:CHASE2 domain-containing sensor protein